MTLPAHTGQFVDNQVLAIKTWEQCLTIIKDQVSTLSFKTWFQPIVPVRLIEKDLTVQVPSQFFYDWLEEHYNTLLHNTITAVIGETSSLFYIVTSEEHPSAPLANSGFDLVSTPIDFVRTQPFAPHVPLRTENLQSIRSNFNPRYTFDSFVVGDCNRFANAALRAL